MTRDEQIKVLNEMLDYSAKRMNEARSEEDMNEYHYWYGRVSAVIDILEEIGK
ncbi:MAG: hypothetical protein IJJ44_12610 [Solobacterium sp.]|nr:hypothetical protein [Solobacterium sp.]